MLILSLQPLHLVVARALATCDTFLAFMGSALPSFPLPPTKSARVFYQKTIKDKAFIFYMQYRVVARAAAVADARHDLGLRVYECHQCLGRRDTRLFRVTFELIITVCHGAEL